MKIRLFLTINKVFFVSFILTSIFLYSCKKSKESDLHINDNIEDVVTEINADSPIEEKKVDSEIKGIQKENEGPIEEKNHGNAEVKIEQPVKNLATKKGALEKEVKKKPKVKKTPSVYGEMVFDDPIFEFGEMVEGEEVFHKFEFTNNGKKALSILRTEVTCGCTIPSYPFLPIEPGEKGFIGVKYNSVGKDGHQEPSVTVYSDGKPTRFKLKLTGNVVPKKKEVEK